MLVLEGVTIKLDLIGVRLDWEKREKLEDFLCVIGEKAGFKGFCVTIDESFGVPKKKLWKQLMYLFLHIKMLDSKISFTFNTFSSAFTLYSSASFWFPVFFTILLYSFLYTGIIFIQHYFIPPNLWRPWFLPNWFCAELAEKFAVTLLQTRHWDAKGK